MLIRTIETVILELKYTDPRRGWWHRIHTLVSEGGYHKAIEIVSDLYCRDTDDAEYNEACIVVANAIVDSLKTKI